MTAGMHPGDVAQFAPDPSTRASAGVDGGPVDALVLTALQDELDAVLAQGAGGRAGWQELRDLGGFRYHRRTFPSARGGQIAVAAAWIGDIGDRTAALRGVPLLDELDPLCLAMCGICAGVGDRTSLGDVIIADRVFGFDEGKHKVGERGVEFQHDLRTFGLGAVWQMDAAFLHRELDLGALERDRPPSKGAQRWWLLHTLFAHEDQGGPAPVAHPDRAGKCPGWTALLKDALRDDLVAMKGGALRLTERGRDKVLWDKQLYPDGLPAEKPLRIHVAPVATVKAIYQDPAIWREIHKVERKTLGLDMQGAAIGDLAVRFEKRFLFMKAVGDHADGDKDDSFRAFACRASATVLLAFLQKHLEPRREEHAPRAGARTRRDKPPAERIDPESPEDPDRRADGFLARVERVARLRKPGADIVRRPAPPPFAGLLEVLVQDGPVCDVSIFGALDQPVTEALVARYIEEVDRPYRLENPNVRSMLVHGGHEAPDALVRDAHRRGVKLKSFSGYQGLLDFTRYLEWQTRRLEADKVYPPGLYVEQPATVSLAGDREKTLTEEALTELWHLLDTPDRPRFALVLGDFGAGKTFLLHELARRMATEKHTLVPVLVEMSKLEKQRSLNALLAQHFALADIGRIDLDAFQYMLAEGRIALLFDGFDELALRVTYDRALEHFETVMQAAHGLAKVVVTSRTQHFLSEHQVRRELARRAELVPGYRLFQLQPFGEKQIRRFLLNAIREPGAAEERYRLLDEVKDLLGLSENPRMLGFIAGIEPEKLKQAKEKTGEITAAKLYELLIDQWLDFEHDRANPPGAPRGISRKALRAAMTEVALTLWHRPVKSVEINELPESLMRAVQTSDAPPLERALVEHLVGSGSLLVRDADGRFSFVHRSVLEWLVAEAAAREVVQSGSAPALAHDEMSDLMADFFLSLAGNETAVRWADETGRHAVEKHARTNATRVFHSATRVLLRMSPQVATPRSEACTPPRRLDLEGQDLRGRSFVDEDLRDANLARADLRGATLVRADLRGASLAGAKLDRADLERARLEGADLTGASLAFARLSGTALDGARGLAPGQFRGAKLVRAKGVVLAGLAEAGAAPPVPGEVAPMWVPVSPCWAVAWSPTGDLVTSGHDNGVIVLWDAVTGQALHTFEGHVSAVKSVAFSPDGTLLASGCSDKTVRLWEVSSGRVLCVFEGHTKGVLSVAFGPDGTLLASGSSDKTVRLWEVFSGGALHVLEGHTNRVQSVAFSPDGTLLASGSSDKTVRLWEVSSGRAARVFERHKNRVLSIAFSPDGTALASGSDDRAVCLWEVSSGRAVRVFEGHTSEVLSVAFGPDGAILTSGSSDKTVRLWEVSSGRTISVFEGHASWVLSVAFSPGGAALASGSSDKTVRLWEVPSGRAVRAFEGHKNEVLSVAFSPGGTVLASGSSDKAVRLWEVSSGRAVRAFEGHKNGVLSVAFSPDGTVLASGSSDHTVRFWEVPSGRAVRAVAGHKNGVRSVAFNSDGTILASGSHDTSVRLWEVSSGRALGVLNGHTDGVRSVAFSRGGITLASGADDNTVCVWEVSSGRAVRTFVGHDSGVQSVAFSPDGATLASGSDDNTVCVWEVSSGRVLRVFEGHVSRVQSVVFSSDGITLASGSSDHTVRIWGVSSGRALRVLAGHKSAVVSIAFSLDGRTLASASADGSLRLWDVATGACLAIMLALPEGWAAFTPDGRYKVGGDVAGSFWHVVGLCRFEPGELDPYLPEPLLLPDDASFLSLPPARGVGVGRHDVEGTGSIPEGDGMAVKPAGGAR